MPPFKAMRTVNADVLPIAQGAKQAFVCYNSGQQRDAYAFTSEGAAVTTINPEQVLDLARRLLPADQRWLALHLQEHLETTLPEHATLDEAVELYIDDWEGLAAALRRHAAEHEVIAVEDTPFGTSYVVEGSLTAPDGRSPQVRVVWFIETGESIPYLVTAYPRKGMRDD
jgi:hypothetical protein